MSWLCRADGSQLLSGVLHTKQAHTLIPEFINPTLGMQTQPQVVKLARYLYRGKGKCQSEDEGTGREGKGRGKGKEGRGIRAAT